MQNVSARLISTEEAARGIFRLMLDVGDVSAKPGQFAHISVPGFTLRRPISIAGLSGGVLELFVQPVGEGTKRLVSLPADTKLSVTLPLGSGFPVEEAVEAAKNGGAVWLVAGGIGAAPLMMCADALADAGVTAESFLGFREESLVFGIERFEKCGRVTKQIGGFVTEPLSEALGVRKPAMILTCGPRPFLKAMKELCCEKHNVKVYASFEEAMGCGIGACLTCSCAVKKDDGAMTYARVCRDGPVFDLERAVF